MKKLTEEQIEKIDRIMRDVNQPKSREFINRITQLGLLVTNHFKDNRYIVSSISQHTETGELFVNYRRQAEFDTFFSRPYEMFVSEVDKDKYPNVDYKYRMKVVDFIFFESTSDSLFSIMVEKIEEYKFKEENTNETI